MVDVDGVRGAGAAAAVVVRGIGAGGAALVAVEGQGEGETRVAPLAKEKKGATDKEPENEDYQEGDEEFVGSWGQAAGGFAAAGEVEHSCGCGLGVSLKVFWLLIRGGTEIYRGEEAPWALVKTGVNVSHL